MITVDLSNLTQYFPDTPFLADIYGCSTPVGVAPATAVQTVAALLGTSTVHVTSPPSATPKEPEDTQGPGGNPTPTAGSTPRPEDPVPTPPPDEPEPEPEQPTTAPPAYPTQPGNSNGECTGVGCYINTGLGQQPPSGPGTASTTQLIVDGQTLVRHTERNMGV
jgi:outer membrane biosynthesis protein TonB